MKMIIDDHQKIFEIREDFSDMFPYLKMEIFSRALSSGEGFPRKIINYGRTLEECRTRNEPGAVVILPETTVEEFERNFRNIYGLNIHVYRQSGKSWLETTLTDSWTLREQNRQGQELSESLRRRSLSQGNEKNNQE